MNLKQLSNRTRAVLAVSSVLSLSSTAVRAADASGAAVLEEIVITAQRREESLQSTAIAATAITGDALNDKAVTNMTDLQFAAPGLTISDGMLAKSINIRGIGLASGSPSVSPGVAMYYDGVFQPPIVGTGTFYDIKDVEVLRGPQGTFVGSNSTGGAMFINTQSPTLDSVKGYGQVTVGNYSRKEVQGAINIPLSDLFALRFAGNYSKHDSYYTDIGPYHNEPEKLDEKSGRMGALLKTDNFQALFKLEYTSRDTGGFAARPIAGTPNAPLAPADVRTLNYDSPTKNHENGLQPSLELRFTLPGDLTLRSMSGYQNKRSANLYDTDATNAGGAPPQTSQDQFVREQVWTEEVNLISPTDGSLDWVVGAYYQKNKIDVDIAQLDSGSPTDILIATEKRTRGVFAQVGYKLTPTLKLDVGVRYSDFNATQVGDLTFATPGGPVSVDLTGSHTDGRPTGKVGLNWNVTNDDLLYAFIARGYKAGGFNSATVEFEPETVLDYEAGWKSTLLDGHLRTQVGAFYNDYKDFQVDTINPVDGRVEPLNVSNGKLYGFELSAQGKFGPVGMDMGYAYVHSKLSTLNFINARLVPPGPPKPSCEFGGIPGDSCINYSSYLASATGKSMLYSPRDTFNAGVDYTFELAAGMTLRPRINFSYMSGQYSYLTYSSIDYLSPRQLWSALLTLEKDTWSVEAFGTNLADKEYVIGKSGFTPTETYGRPREYGVRASVKF